LGSIAVSTPELEAAASTLGGARAELVCGGVSAGGLGSPELEAAIDEFAAQADRVAGALAEAIYAASANLNAAAAGYIDADLLSMPPAGGRG
jgi:hypothetical protein